jgi:hypothetical protein
MTGHLEELLNTLIHLLKRWFISPQHSSQMVPVRVRSRGALHPRQFQPSVVVQNRNNAFPSKKGGVRFSAVPPPDTDRGEFGPFCPLVQRDDL